MVRPLPTPAPSPEEQIIYFMEETLLILECTLKIQAPYNSQRETLALFRIFLGNLASDLWQTQL